MFDYLLIFQKGRQGLRTTGDKGATTTCGLLTVLFKNKQKHKQNTNIRCFIFQSTEKISTVFKELVKVITEKLKNKVTNTLTAFHPDNLIFTSISCVVKKWG